MSTATEEARLLDLMEQREERLVLIHSLEGARLLNLMEQREERLVLIHSLEEAQLLDLTEQREERLSSSPPILLPLLSPPPTHFNMLFCYAKYV